MELYLPHFTSDSETWVSGGDLYHSRKLQTKDYCDVWLDTYMTWLQGMITEQCAVFLTLIRSLDGRPLPKTVRFGVTKQLMILSLNPQFKTLVVSSVHLLTHCTQDVDANVIALQEAVEYTDTAKDPVGKVL